MCVCLLPKKERKISPQKHVNYSLILSNNLSILTRRAMCCFLSKMHDDDDGINKPYTKKKELLFTVLIELCGGNAIKKSLKKTLKKLFPFV